MSHIIDAQSRDYTTRLDRFDQMLDIFKSIVTNGRTKNTRKRDT